MDKEMMKALMADGEKLRAMTGEDHGPYFIYDEDDAGDLEQDWLFGPTPTAQE
jgi:hypothetical protein